jgi:hypothetical protein
LNTGIDLFIGKGQFVLCGVERPDDSAKLGQTPAEFAQVFSAFSKQHRNLDQRPITIYVGDDLLYFTRIDLPKQTPDIEKAINLQMDMISPFGENSLYAYDIQHGKEMISVSLYLADRRIIQPILETIHGLEYRIHGLYPESQRWLNQANRKKDWGLLTSGLFHKLTIFKAGRVAERLQISGQPDQPLLKKTYGLKFIQDYENLAEQPSPPATPLGFDLLPTVFRRTDYGKWLVFGLLGLNLILGLGWLGSNFIELQSQINQISSTHKELAPQLAELKKLRKQQSSQAKKLKRYGKIGKNKDLIALFASLTENLPQTSYLDQLRLDKKSGAIHMQGYTSNLGELTASLRPIGNATLESTHKRKGQTYFKIEVLPK